MADNHEEISKINGAIKRTARANYIRSIGIVLLGSSALVTAFVAWNIQNDNKELRKEQECRFDISTEVNAISDRIDATTAEIFVAAIDEDEVALDQLAKVLQQEIEELVPAIERRSQAVEICRE